MTASSARHQVMNISAQVKRLRGFFPHLKSYNARVARQRLPMGAQGYFAIPRWERIDRTYAEASHRIVQALSLSIKFYPRSFWNGERYPKQYGNAAASWEKLGKQQESDILIVAAQLGEKYRDTSVKQIRERKEFGLGAFHVGCILLTHPHFFGGGVCIDCPGDECDIDLSENHETAPYFYNNGEWATFSSFSIYAVHGGGGASAVLS